MKQFVLNPELSPPRLNGRWLIRFRQVVGHKDVMSKGKPLILRAAEKRVKRGDHEKEEKKYEEKSTRERIRGKNLRGCPVLVAPVFWSDRAGFLTWI